MKEVYITSTLKNEWNVQFNKKLCTALETKGITCHLPSRDTDQSGDEQSKYSQNISGMDNARKIIAIGQNESINWGLEVGYAFGKGQAVILLCQNEHAIPVMSYGMYQHVVRVANLDMITLYINELITKIQS